MTLKEQEKIFLMSLSNTLNMKQVRNVLVEYEHIKDMKKTNKELFKELKEDDKA